MPWTQVVFLQACVGQYSAECSKGTVYRYPGFFASTALSFLIFCSVNSKYPGRLNFLSSRSFLGSAQVPLPLCHGLEILSRQYTEAMIGLTSFVSHLVGITDLHYLMSSFLETFPLIFCLFLICLFVSV